VQRGQRHRDRAAVGRGARDPRHRAPLGDGVAEQEREQQARREREIHARGVPADGVASPAEVREREVGDRGEQHQPHPEVEQVAERAPAPEEREGRGVQEDRDPLHRPAELGEPVARQALDASMRGERDDCGAAGECERDRHGEPPGTRVL
jgi:hypothetical protein